jgi:hypothetical protein
MSLIGTCMVFLRDGQICRGRTAFARLTQRAITDRPYNAFIELMYRIAM